MELSWLELRMEPGADLRPIYALADKCKCETIHHFYYEAWHPDGAVVRVGGKPPAISRFTDSIDRAEVERIDPWDASADERLYEDLWPDVYAFFEATGRIAAAGYGKNLLLLKLTHCHLNARGLDVDDEAKWLGSFVKNRLRMAWKDRRRLRDKRAAREPTPRWQPPPRAPDTRRSWEK